MENPYGMKSSEKELKTALELAEAGNEAEKRPSIYEKEQEPALIQKEEEAKAVDAEKKPDVIKERWISYANELYGDPKEYTPEQILNDESFMSFIESTPQEQKGQLYERIKDPELLREHYDAFRYKDRVIESLTAIHSGVLKEELGVDVSKEVGEQSGKEVAKLALENPVYVKALYASFEEYRRTEKVIHTKKEAIAGILKKSGVDSLVSLEKKKERLELVAGTVGGFFNWKNSEVLGWFFRTTEENQARKDTPSEYNVALREIPKLAQEAKEQLKTVADADKWIKKITEVCGKQRNELLLQTSASEGLYAISRTIIGEQMKKLFGGKTGALNASSSLKELQGAVDYYNRFRALREKGGPDFTGVFNTDEREFEEKLTAFAEDRFKEDLKKNILNIGIPTINKLKGVITPLLKERMGFHTDEMAREKVLSFAREVEDQLSSPLARMALASAISDLAVTA